MKKIIFLISIAVMGIGLAACKAEPDDLDTPALSAGTVSEARTPDNDGELAKPTVDPYELDSDFYSKFIDISRFDKLCAEVVSSTDYVSNASEIAFQSNMLLNEMLKDQSYSLPSDADITAELERLYDELSRVAEENGVDEEELIDCYGITEDEFIMYTQMKVLNAVNGITETDETSDSDTIASEKTGTNADLDTGNASE